ncbi:hypothetical protein ACQ4WR_23385 [Janthinobacterium sp. RT4P48]
MSIAGRKARRAAALLRHPSSLVELQGTGLLQIPGFFNHPAVGDPFAHHFRMLRGSHGRHGHQVLQLRGIAVVTFHKTAQMLGSVVDELAVSDSDYALVLAAAPPQAGLLSNNSAAAQHTRSYCAAKSCLQYDSAQIKDQKMRRQRKADGAGLNRPGCLLLVVDAHQHANKFTRDLTMMFI